MWNSPREERILQGIDRPDIFYTVRWAEFVSILLEGSSTVDSRYLEIKGTLKNSSRYPYFDISDL